MKEQNENQPNAFQIFFDHARESMTKVLEAYKKAHASGERMSSIDLYEFPSMMRNIREMERKNLERVLNGDALQKIEDTPEFAALAHHPASAKAITRSHIYELRRAIAEELEREGKNVSELKRILMKDEKNDSNAYT